MDSAITADETAVQPAYSTTQCKRSPEADILCENAARCRIELRHLRCFIFVAEELNFTRAAARLHIEQSPLSRIIKELESELAISLFERHARGVRLTWPGQVFFEEAKRIFTALEQARSNVQSAAAGYRGMLRIALSDCIVPQRLANLLANCRVEEPEVEIRLHEVPFTQQVHGLLNGLYDAGFARSDALQEGILSRAVWSDALVAMLPARHPLLVHREVPIKEVLRYPLILCHPTACKGHYQQMERLLQSAVTEAINLNVAEHAASPGVMAALVAAGYGVGLTSASQLASPSSSDIITRPLAGPILHQTTYFLHAEGDRSPQLERFIDRTKREFDYPAIDEIRG